MDNAEASGLPTLTLEHLPLSWPEDCHGAPLRPDRQAMGSSDAYHTWASDLALHARLMDLALLAGNAAARWT
jgi:hypothetical protein